MHSTGTNDTPRRTRWVRFPLLGVVLLAAAFAPVSVDLDTGSIGIAEAACHDCRPAPEGWTCHHEEKRCPLSNEACSDMPL